MGSERVPYMDGLTEGQGFNTYDQSGCMHDAVTIDGQLESAEPPNFETTYRADMISDYEKLIKSLEVSAGAGVSKWGIGGSVDATFLDRSEFEASFLTYLVRVDVRRQPGSKSHYSLNWKKRADPHTTYGDRFISDFVRGGALFARVSIITRDTTMHREIQQAANIAFPVYGVDVKVTEEIKTSMENIHKHSEVHIYLHYVGAPPGYQAESSGNQLESLLQLKHTADKFVADAKSHQWKRFALLEKYTNIGNWNDQFTPLDYAEAKDRSWAVLSDFTEYLAIQNMIRAVKQENYGGGREKRDGLDTHASDVLGGYRRWVANVVTEPGKANRKPPYAPPETFRREVLLSVKRTRYIAQSLHLQGGRSTHIIDDRLHQQATKLFELEAYNFGDVTGTAKLLFGKKAAGNKYLCLIGRSITAGYEELSHLWVFDQPIPGAFEQKVNVMPIFDEGTIKVELQNGGRQESDLLFSFYVRIPST